MTTAVIYNVPINQSHYAGLTVGSLYVREYRYFDGTWS